MDSKGQSLQDEQVVNFPEDTPEIAPEVAPELKAVAGSQIDQASAEAFIAEKRIGERIKRLRLKKSMGLVELGKHTGLSASFLSQLETGRVVPTLRNLARISIVFGKDLSYFFEAEPQAMFRIHRKKERMRMPQTGVDDPTYYFESLGYMVPDRQLDPYYAEFLPQTKAAEIRPHVHPGFEFLYVLEGELEIRHAEKSHVLEVGDGVYFDASTPHAYKCHGKTPAIVIIVTMHQQHMQQAPAIHRSLGAALQGRQAALGSLATRTAAALQTSGSNPAAGQGASSQQVPSLMGQVALPAARRRERPVV